MSLQSELQKINNPDVSAFILKVRRRPELPLFLFSQTAIAGAIRTATLGSRAWRVEEITFPGPDSVTARFRRLDAIEFKTAGVNPTIAIAVAGFVVTAIAAVVIVIEITPILEKAPGAVTAAGIGISFLGAAVLAVAVASLIKTAKG